ncbi:hypothetical protein MPSEU_001073400 [Mayamaea pseudoterrestris]|nr:hypothetical protein MPSEU_001073400 [Mayamaea pseudoterrestris]
MPALETFELKGSDTILLRKQAPDSEGNDAAAAPRTLGVGSVSSLVFAMAPTENVLQAFMSNKDAINDEQSTSMHAQNSFVEALSIAWKDPYGPSKSYLIKLVKSFIRRYIGDDEDRLQQSENLLALLAEMLTLQGAARSVPDPDEYCHLSFPLPSDDDDKELLLLRIRIYPYHNDVSLRLWEAGAVLAEYLIQHSSLIHGQTVVELGAGVGLTGLVCTATCRASHVTCTDYSTGALENMRYNYNLLLHSSSGATRYSRSDYVFEALHLDWSEIDSLPVASNSIFHETGNSLPMMSLGLKAVKEANVLLAADVIYDACVIPSLVRVMQSFFKSPTGRNTKQPKTALFAATLRNKASLNLFRRELVDVGLSLEILFTGQECERLPPLFPTKFVQPRRDVQIYRIRCDSVIQNVKKYR